MSSSCSPHTFKRGEFKSILMGMLFMSVVSATWSALLPEGVPGWAAWLLAELLMAHAMWLAWQSLRLWRQRSWLPASLTALEQYKAKRIGLWFGLLCTAEGIAIGVTANLLARFGLPGDTVPAIAIIVGLHFHPMAWIFARRFDHLVAVWAVFVGVSGLVAQHLFGWPPAWSWAWVGSGMALATAAYGRYFLGLARNALRSAVNGGQGALGDF